MTHEDSRYHYKKGNLLGVLLLGFGYLIIGILGYFFSANSFSPGLALIGFVFLIDWYIKKNKGYISIDEKYLSKNKIFRKKLPVEKINGLRYYISNLTIIADDKELDVDKDYLKKEDFERLESQVKRIIKKNKFQL